ncbi:MAG: hypothetical protein HOK84_09415 [Bacteroidetes bacterium]|jgi:hypothetical protein|nr:hypothetical protein [Bacteroidota bacterium]MBT4400423.1 hypothetical protein [Bacteroidota bacterium]MBT4409665.1 hypothetical protein [Bacteroidota bacterium]MBT5426402.1 hypothetical protein [Bacteroidota bacterium]MBT7465593.1 hypothetical protein [Bacteroidota bacterium]
MKRIVLLAVSLILAGISFGQDGKFGIKFSGFVKNDAFLDSRQTVAAREGHFLLWPSKELLDEKGEDINAKSNFNMLAIQSRMKAAISGPDAFGAKTSGVIEADFFAQANDNVNLLRMRHAFIKLNWTHLELLAGQYWNPLFVTDCFPGTVSFNTGTPLQSFARNPQIRLSYKSGGLKITAAALSQRDYSSRGANGVSSEYLRNSSIPDMHFQAQYGGAGFVAGAGLAYKTLAPRLMSEPIPLMRYSVDEKVGGLTVIGFTKITTKPLTFKLEARYGENIADVLAISGFAVSSVTDITSGSQSYTPLTSMTVWGEIHTNGKVQFGVFGGVFKNLGTKEEMLAGGDIYGLGTDIDALIRVSPRVVFNSNKTRIALEMEYTQAAYGNNFDVSYKPETTNVVSNLRGLVAIYYFF